MTSRSLSNLALAMMALPALLGACLCLVRPQRTWLWLIAMLVMPAAWFGVREAFKALRRAATAGSTLEAQDRVAVAVAVIVASMVVAMPLGARLAEALGLIGPPLAQAISTRWANVLVGGYLVFKGNRLPKILTPLADAPFEAASFDALRRRTGWIVVLAGFAYTVLWLAAPAAVAEPVGLALIAAGILVPVAIIRTGARRRVRSPGR
jgi:hypothetical protein